MLVLHLRTVKSKTGYPGRGWQKRFRYILIDEFQDINADPV